MTDFDYRQGVSHEGIGPFPSLEESGWTILSGQPVQSVRVDYGGFEEGPLVGIWSCTPGTIEIESLPYNEFVTMYEGDVVATLNDGNPIALKPGDSFFVPKGGKIRWEIRQTVSKYLIISGSAPVVN